MRSTVRHRCVWASNRPGVTVARERSTTVASAGMQRPGRNGLDLLVADNDDLVGGGRAGFGVNELAGLDRKDLRGSLRGQQRQSKDSIASFASSLIRAVLRMPRIGNLRFRASGAER